MGAPNIDSSGVALPQYVLDALRSGNVEDAVNSVNTYLDTLSEDERKLAINALVVAPWLPILSPPQDLANMLELKISEAKSAVLDAWLDNIAEIAEQRRRERESTAGRIAEELQSTHGQQKNEIEHWWLKLPGQDIFTISALDDYFKNKDLPKDAVPFMTAAFIITASYTGDFMGVVDQASTGMVAANPIQDAATHISQVIPPELETMFLPAINLFAMGAMYRATAAGVGDIAGGDSQKDVEFARGFLKEMLDKTRNGNNEVNLLVEGLLANGTSKGTKVTEAQAQQLTTIVKLTLLAIGLAVFEKIATGWLNPDGFADLLQGKPPLDPNTPEGQAQAQAMNLLSQLPGNVRESFLNAIKGAFNQKFDTDQVLNPMKTLSGSLSQILNVYRRMD